MPRKRGAIDSSGDRAPAAKQRGPKRARLKLPARDVSNHASVLKALESHDIAENILSFLDIVSGNDGPEFNKTWVMTDSWNADKSATVRV